MPRTETLEYIIVAKDKASGVFNKVGNTTQAVGGKLKGLAGIAGGVATAGLAAAGVAAIGFGRSAIAAAAQTEQLMTSFKVMTGSAETAKKLMGELDQFANVTPFENMDVRTAAKSLMAFGVEADEVQDQLRKIGDVAALAGKPIGDMAAIYGKALAKGKLQAEELNQIAESGVPIIETLSKKYNKTGGEIFEMASKGELGADVLKETFDIMTSEGGPAFNMMGEQSETLTGKISTLKGTFTLLAQKVGEKLLPTIKPAIDGVIAGVQGMINIVTGEGGGGGFRGAIDGLLDKMPLFKEAMNGAVTAVSFLWETHGEQIKQVVYQIWSVVKSIGDSIASFWENHGETVIGVLNAIWKMISGIISFAMTTILGIINFALAVLRGDWALAWDTIKETVKNGWQSIKQILKGIDDFLRALAGDIYASLTRPFREAYQYIKEKATDIRKTIAGAFDMDKRNSPSINDRLNMLKTGIQANLDSVVVPQYSADIAKQLSSSDNQVTNNNSVVFNNSISNNLDFDTVDRQLALSLNRTGIY